MAKKKDYKAMTIRLDPNLAEQIEKRAEIHKRSRTQEIEYLLGRALDQSAESDRGLIHG